MRKPQNTQLVPNIAASTEVTQPTMPPAEVVESLAARAKRLKTELDLTLAEIAEEHRLLGAQLQELGYGAAVAPTGKPCKVCGKYGHDARSHRWEKAKGNRK
jgi:hypothetical protein